MDPHVRWLRRRIAGGLLRLGLAWLAVATALGLLVATALVGTSALSLLPWALVFGQIVLLGGLARAFFSNPLSYPYLRRNGGELRRFELADAPVEGPAGGWPSAALQPLIAMRQVGSDGVVFDVFQSDDRLITAAVSRSTGAISAFSRLADGCILVTDEVLAVPHAQLVVNPIDSGDDAIVAHRRALMVLGDEGVVAVEDDGFVFIETLGIEHDALAALGSLFAPFLSLGRQSMPLRFLVPVDPTELSTVARRRPMSPLDLVSPSS